MATIIAREVDFNRDADSKEFDTTDKVIRMYGFRNTNNPEVSFSFELGRKEDDTMSFAFRLGELLTAICETMANPED